MRSLPMFWRMAEEMARMPRLSSPFHAFFHEPPVWSVTLPRNWQQIARWQEQEFAPPATVNKDGYKLTLDVKDYSELKVKVLDESVVLVEGKSEQQEAEQGGYSSRHFLRRFVLPEGYEADKVTSTLSSDGVLTISVPNPPGVQETPKEREVTIEQTGEPAKKSVEESNNKAASQ